MDNSKDFFIVENKYLANGLAFLGFRYYKFTDVNNKLVYSFKRTDKFLEVVELMYKTKSEVNIN